MRAWKTLKQKHFNAKYFHGTHRTYGAYDMPTMKKTTLNMGEHSRRMQEHGRATAGRASTVVHPTAASSVDRCHLQTPYWPACERVECSRRRRCRYTPCIAPSFAARVGVDRAHRTMQGNQTFAVIEHPRVVHTKSFTHTTRESSRPRE